VWDRDFPLDPYVIRGDPASGLLPLIQPGERARRRTGPRRAGYCSAVPEPRPGNSIPWRRLRTTIQSAMRSASRFIEACLQNGDRLDLRWFRNTTVAEPKWDSTRRPSAATFPAPATKWPEASYARASKSPRSTRTTIAGCCTSWPRIRACRKTSARGHAAPTAAKDEFTDNAAGPISSTCAKAADGR